jgi:hypothetical protein
MRITVLVGVPLVVTYRIVRQLFALGRGRDGGTRSGSPIEPPSGSVDASPRADRAVSL